MEPVNITNKINDLLSEDEKLRQEAFEFLDVIDPSLLLEMLPEIDWEQRKEVAQILVRKKGKLIPGINKKLATTNEDIKFWCIHLLGDIDCDESTDLLIKITDTEAIPFKKPALQALKQKKDMKKIVPAVVNTLYTVDWSLNCLARNILVDNIKCAGEFILKRCQVILKEKKYSQSQKNLINWSISIFGITRYRPSMHYLLDLLGNKQIQQDLYVIEALCRLGDSAMLDKVIEFLKKCDKPKDWFLVQKTLIYLKDLDISKHIPFFISFLKNSEWGIQQSASKLLMNYSEHNPDFFITALKQNDHKNYRYWIPRILSKSRNEKSLKLIHSLLQDSGESLLDFVQIDTAGRIGNEATGELLSGLFSKTQSWFLKKNIIRALGNLKFKKAEPLLKKLIKDENYHIRVEASKALTRIQHDEL